MKHKSIFTLSLLSLGLIIGLSSCGGGEEEGSGRKQYNFERADSLSKDYEKDLGNVKVNIENTANLFSAIVSKGIEFDKSVLTSSSQNFSTSKSQALGFGIFGACLSYTTINGQSQDANEYIKAIYAISDKLGIGEAFDHNLVEKLANMEDGTNKSILLTKAYIKASDQLYNEDRATLVTMMVAGGFVEGLLISSSVIPEVKPQTEIALGIYDQINSYDNTMEMLRVFSDNKEVKEVHTSLQSIAPIIKECKETRGKISPELLQKLNGELKTLMTSMI